MKRSKGRPMGFKEIEKTCEWPECGKKFFRQWPSQKYCCPECRVKAERAYQREYAARVKKPRRLTDKKPGRPPKVKYKSCEGCRYWRPFCSGSKACHYFLDTGKLRNIPQKVCMQGGRHSKRVEKGSKSR